MVKKMQLTAAAAVVKSVSDDSNDSGDSNDSDYSGGYCGQKLL